MPVRAEQNQSIFKLLVPGLLLALIMAAVGATSLAAQDPPANKKVLMLFGDDSSTNTQVTMERALRSTLKNGSPVPVETYSEYVGNRRTGADYEEELVDLLEQKYDGKKFDVVFGIGQFPITLIQRNGTKLFPDTPFVFLTIDRRNVVNLYPAPGITGVWGEINFKSNLELALALRPGTKRVAVIQGVSDTDKFWAGLAKEDFREYESKFEFSDLAGLSIPEMRTALANLPRDTIVFFVSHIQDKAGNSYESPEYLRQISTDSAAPIFGTTGGQLGNGIVGGSLLSFEALGAEGGQVGLRLLAGEKPETIEPHLVPGSPMFDWRQLQKWSISESRLPQGSTVQFKQPTFWEEYKWYAIGLTTAVTVETLLIVFLIYLRVRRRQAENEAKQLSSRLSEIVSNVPGIVWESRAVEGQNQRTTTFISDYVQKMLGYSPDEWLKQPPGFGLDLVPEEERERVLRESDAVIESGQEGVSEFRWKTKDGQIRWIENYLSPLVDGDSSIVGLRGVALDVTDRKLAENRLRESELFNRAILSSLNTHVCVLDGDGRIISVNYSWAAFALDNGLPSEASVGPGVNYFDVCRRAVIEGDKLAQSALDGVRAVCDGSLENFHLEYPCHSPDEKRWFLMIVTPLKDSKGGAVVVHNDITSSKLAAEAVRESEKRFRNMAENAPVIIWISDEEQSTTYLNKYWMEFTGSKLEKETGLEWTRHVHSDDRAPALEIYNDAFERREPFELEFRARRVDGEYRWIASSGAPRFTPEGQFVGYIGTGVDITERKESEGALKQAHEELKKLKAKLEAENIYLQEELRQDQAFGDIVGQSDAIKYVLYKVGQVAPIDSTVLISGETGTGKELVARAIHEASQRKSRPLIKVNCAALTSSLIESELFGHEKGAFTGAGARKLGRFELANRGTLLLDEIGELPLDLQSKLLRVLQEGEFERVGSGNTIKTDVRIIASTNRDLRQAVEKGTFREDLWYRLNVFPITTPPLRERRDDIPLLTEHFGRTFARKFGKELTAVSPETMTALCMYSWPGNVRELANVIERAVINLHGTVLKIREDFPIQQAESLAASVKTLDAMEREHIVRVLDDLNWRIDGPKGAARILGINASTLRTRMVKLGIHKPNGHNPSSMIEN